MKKKVLWIALAVIVLLLIIMALIYTRPRTLDTIIGEETPIAVYASTSANTFRDGQIEEERWQFSDEQEHDPAICAKTMELVGRIKYRLDLRSLTHPNLVEGDHSKVDGNTMLFLAFENGRAVSVDHLGSAVAINLYNGKGFLTASVVNEEALIELADYIAEIGEKS